MDLTPLIQSADTKILLVVMDGLGGYADADHGTELEEADHPEPRPARARGHRRAGSSRSAPASPPARVPGTSASSATTPSSSSSGAARSPPPVSTSSSRAGDVAARGNLATLGADGAITDRRAGRIPDAEAQVVVDELQAGVRCPASRCSSATSASTGCWWCCAAPASTRASPTPTRSTPASPPLAAEPLDPEAKRTADLLAEVDAQVRRCSPTSPRPTSCCSAASTPTASSPGSTTRFGLPRRRRRHLPDVPRHRPPARHGRARAARRPRRAARHPARRMERLRLLLPAPQVHRLRR